ncbi:MAG: M28 family peptidase [Phaeodactylibacter sp.]|nr:M28 family peptidase [Phaeodactylibacter sp.]MCB9290244.1 M28 family peptidase [Lewinellaceae bacterium]
MKKLLTALLIAFCLPVFGQYQPAGEQPGETPAVFGAMIGAEGLEEHLAILASDEFEGRETGQPGQRKAAEYIAGVFQGYGFPKVVGDSSYFQKIAFTAESWNRVGLSINGDDFRHLWDYYSYPSTNASLPEATFEEVLFLGYGIESERYNDYKDADVNGKAILIYDGEPVDASGISRVTGTEERSEWATDWRKKLRLARKKGASLVLIIDGNFKQNVDQARRAIFNTGLQYGEGEKPELHYANNCFITTKVAREILGKDYKKVIRARKNMQKKGKPKAVPLKCRLTIRQEKFRRQVLGENVLGYIEGTDEKLKKELLIVTAHYDHLGRRGPAIYNGADDNGSGTAAVLEVAEAFAEARKQGAGPRRSVLFMLVSGEEKGLLGSQYYVEHPVFPLENTIADINVDMVGRVDEKHKDNPEYIYVIGSDRLSTELHQINEQANATYTKLELDYTYNAEDDPNRYYYRSDHYNFAQRGIPAIFYFNGTHADYHRTSDTVDKIQFGKMAKIAQLVFYTAWELANREERIKVDVK